MKVKIIIEETISQEFEVEITDLEKGFEEIQKLYKDGTLVVDDPNLIDTQLMIFDEDGSEIGWNRLL